jgi:hypothetical protein
MVPETVTTVNIGNMKVTKQTSIFIAENNRKHMKFGVHYVGVLISL